MARLVLVGLPGAGKSTLAPLLADQWGVACLDTDDVVREMTGRGVADWIRDAGEDAFREVEADALERALVDDVVVSTGGGIVTSERSRRSLESAPVLWLDAPLDLLARRIDGGDRPLVADDPRVRLAELNRERRPLYARVATWTLSSEPRPENLVTRARALVEDPVSIHSVRLAERSYDVVVARGARHRLAGLLARLAPRARRVAFITTPTLREQPWWDLEVGLDPVVIDVPDGESAKSLATLETVCERLARAGLSRDDVVVSVGGGAVCDLAGFAAAVYLRGVRVVHVATTLLAQVDAAIGGKTAVDIPAGKNLVGAFHQPLGVLCDLEVLETLPEREWRSGWGEVVKCVLLTGARDASPGDVRDLVNLSVALKARIVSADEREGGERALLNYGHTLAHAIEALALERDVDELRHGEAVAVGLAFATRLATRLGRVGASRISEVDALLSRFGLSSRLGEFSTERVLEFMARDKKAHHDLTFVLDGPRGVEVVPEVDVDVVRDTLETMKGES